MRRSLSAVAILTVLATPLLAQQTGRKAHEAGYHMEYAAVGTLARFDRATMTLDLALPADSEAVLGTILRYRFTDGTTLVGLNPGDQIGTLAGQEGAALVVRYENTSTQPVVKSIWFLGAEKIREVSGKVTRVDRANHLLIVRNKAGGEESITLAKHTPIVGKMGIVPMADIHEGQMMNVYFVREGSHRDARLVRVMASKY